MLPHDPHSKARPNEVRVTHLALDLELDFERKQARGSARLCFERMHPSAALVLDSQGLAIERVTGVDGVAREYELSAEDPLLGTALSIPLGPGDRELVVHYRTTDKSAAMQWLAPQQTAGKRQPFLFTQGQSILTRTWIPLQDTPGARLTYEARIRCPAGLTPVMSAEQLGRDAEGVWRFALQHPIPSYLIALACGELEFRPVSPRSGVWAEPSVVGGAARELEDTEAMIAAAETLFGPYRWGRYDILVLPPSFPFGGMENPRLTFATPTILAGDKSLVALVAHELAHSWSGNLVTNATWSDFWLNESFTVYCESRIMEEVYGAERARMEQQLARRDLLEEMKELQPWQQVLRIDLEGRNPDDGFSGVPYEKGAMLLRRLEQLAGRPAFERFLREWFEAHAFGSVTTDDFVACARDGLASATAQVDFHAWLEEPGLPPDAPDPRSELLARVDREVEAWSAGRTARELDTAGYSTQQWLRLLQQLPEVDEPGHPALRTVATGRRLDAAAMAELDQVFDFSHSGNSEIANQWLWLAIRHRYAPADARLEEFLIAVGRRKFLKPLYTELSKTPAGLAKAKAIYAKARPGYHAVSVGTIDGILGWKR